MALYKKSEYSLHVTDVLLSLQTAAQFHSKSKDEIWQPFGTYYGKHKEEKKNNKILLATSVLNFLLKSRQKTKIETDLSSHPRPVIISWWTA